jgi:hypothetical protein
MPMPLERVVELVCSIQRVIAEPIEEAHQSVRRDSLVQGWRSPSPRSNQSCCRMGTAPHRVSLCMSMQSTKRSSGGHRVTVK